VCASAHHQRGAANNIIVLILIEICILFADPHIFMRCAKQIHNKTSASMGFAARIVFCAVFAEFSSHMPVVFIFIGRTGCELMICI
jgi:hypothetical protein